MAIQIQNYKNKKKIEVVQMFISNTSDVLMATYNNVYVTVLFIYIRIYPYNKHFVVASGECDLSHITCSQSNSLM